MAVPIAPQATAPGKGGGSRSFPKVAAAIAFLALLGGAGLFLKGIPKGSQATFASPGVQEQDPAEQKPAEIGSSASVPVAGREPNLADQIHGSPIKRSGSSEWEVVFPYYQEAAGAGQMVTSTQEKKGKLAILPGRLVVDQVGDNFITATHSGSREQWVLHPDNPNALNEISISEGISIAQLVGVYAGPEQMETASGAPRRLPAMIVFGMLTSNGYVDFEDPDATRASTRELKPFVDQHQSREASERAKEKAELDAREAERQAQRAKDLAELEQDPSWNKEAKAGGVPEPSGHEDKRQETPRAKTALVELAKARADLAAVNSRIESERKRHADALNVINTLTKNKTVPVREGSAAHSRCLAASRIIGDVERGAPELKAEKSRLETLVNELDPEIQE